MLKKIIETIRVERIRRKMTLKELSAVSTVSVKQICDIENGKVNPNLNTLEKLARSLGLIIKIGIISVGQMDEPQIRAVGE